MTTPDDEPATGPGTEPSPEAPGVGGDARMHNLGGDIGRSPSGSRGGGGLGPSEVRELDDGEG